jgi:methylase of polypeptide subunit release factors
MSCDSKADIIRKRGYRKAIQGDEHSLYISSYPQSAKHLASRIGNIEKVFTELCCGIGINLEYLANSFKSVNGVDIDATVIHYCSQNLLSSGLSHDKFRLIVGDIRDEALLKSLQSDIVLYDVPYWYENQFDNDGELLKKNPDLASVVSNIRKHITHNIVIYAPTYFRYEDISRLGSCEFQRVFINGRHDRNIIYFGSLASQDGITEVSLG